MELEVVSTEGSVESDRGCRYGRGYKDEGRSRKSVPARDPLQFEWEAIRHLLLGISSSTLILFRHSVVRIRYYDHRLRPSHGQTGAAACLMRPAICRSLSSIPKLLHGR